MKKKSTRKNLEIRKQLENTLKKNDNQIQHQIN